MTDTYNGWTNRETWALVLHIQNDQGWHHSVLEQLREAVDAKRDAGEEDPFWWSEAGDVVRAEAERLLTVDGYIEWGGGDHLPAVLSRVAEDIGSLYRVDWTEVGRSFLEDIGEE